MLSYASNNASDRIEKVSVEVYNATARSYICSKVLLKEIFIIVKT